MYVIVMHSNKRGFEAVGPFDSSREANAWLVKHKHLWRPSQPDTATSFSIRLVSAPGNYDDTVEE